MPVLNDPLVAASCLLMVWSAVLWAVPSRRVTGADLTASEVGYLRGGERWAVLSSLVALHLAGAVVEGRRGTVKRDGPPPDGLDDVERAVYASLHGHTPPTMLLIRPRVRRALARVRTRLAKGGLLVPSWRWIVLRCALVAVPALGVAALIVGRPAMSLLAVLVASAIALLGVWRLPRRTVAGTLAVRALARRNPLPEDPELSVDAAAATTLVSLHRAPALRALLPNFTRDGGLLDDGGISAADNMGDQPATRTIPYG